MEKIAFELITKFGTPGLLLVIGGYLILKTGNFFNKLQDDHRNERKELTKRLFEQGDNMNSSFNKNTEVLSELRTLIRK